MKNKNLFWVVGIIIILIVVIAVYYFNTSSQNVTIPYAHDTSCNINSDCVIKDNGVNCPAAFNINDKGEYKQDIPPSHTVCPKTSNLIAYCENNNCLVKYDCSKCDLIKEENGDTLCLNKPYSTNGYVCRLYDACNCS